MNLWSIHFSRTFKHKHGGKVSTNTSCASTKLEMNYEKSFNKAVIKNFCHLSFKDFGNYRNLKILEPEVFCEKKVVLNISQISQENICWSLFLIKL